MAKKIEQRSKGKEKQLHKHKKGGSSKRPPGHRRARWVIIALLSLVMVYLSYNWIPGDLHYTIVETYTFSGAESAPLQLAVLLPTSGPYQAVLEPEITWPGTWEIHPDGRLNVVWLETDLQAGEIVTAVIKYPVNLSLGKTHWDGERVTPRLLSPSETIQSDHLEIVNQAEGLLVAGDEGKTARRIFDFTIHHLDRQVEDRLNLEISALSAFESGVGGSIKSANLMTALSRAIEIPSRTVSGLVMPEIIPLFPVSATGSYPGSAHAWVELFVNDAWMLADPGWPGQFYKRNLLGWADGKHLVYEEITREAEVYGRLLAEAEQSGVVIGAMSTPLRFVAWSEIAVETFQVVPEVTLRKTWDPRLLMIFSVVMILVVLNWLYESDERRVSVIQEKSK
jgi:transglutaminase-like putative cysteine protease